MKLLKSILNFIKNTYVNVCGFFTGSAASVFTLVSISSKAAVVAESAAVASGLFTPAAIPIAVQAAALVAPVIAERCGVFKHTYNFGSIPGESAATASVYVAGGVLFGTQAAITHAFNRVTGTFSGWIFADTEANNGLHHHEPSMNIPVAEYYADGSYTVSL